MFNQLSQGDVLPIDIGGEIEKWIVEKIKTTETGVDLTLTLQVMDNKTVHPVEYRRKQLFEPHSAIKTEIPTSWITEV